MRNFSVLALALVASVTACRDSGGGNNNTTPDTPGNSNDTKIQDIQNDAMPEGTAVTIKGVVVTAIDNYGAKTGDFWIEEPGGGPFSGVHVYGAPLDQVAALALGDVVDLSGAAKTEFALSTDTSGNKLTELEPVMGGTMTVTKVSSGTPITPDVVDALAIGQMSDYMARAAEWEKWEGVLITVNNVAAASSDAPVGMTDPTLHKFSVTGDVAVESALAAMPTTAVRSNDCLGSVTGVLDYFFDYQILPRTTAEIVTGGTACPPKENSPALCTDGIDNDGNGFGDCNDNNCIAAESTCRTVTTISAIQTAATPPTGGVELDGVCVVSLSRPTGMTPTPKNMWVQTGTALASVNNGLYIFGTGADLSAFAPGTKVNVVGTVTEFNDSMGTGTLTELKALTITAATGACAPTPILNQDAATLSIDANGEPAESVYVELKNVKITAVGTMANFYAGTMQQGTTTFKYDDDAFRIPATDVVGTCYSSIKGFWSYQVYDNAWQFLPSAAGTPGGTCP